MTDHAKAARELLMGLGWYAPDADDPHCERDRKLIEQALTQAETDALERAARLADEQAAHCRKVRISIEWSRDHAAEQCDEIAYEIRALKPAPGGNVDG